METLDTFKNLAPIMDAILVDPEKSGQVGSRSLLVHSANYFQPQIVTCSGSHNTGSLRVVRNGADIKELAVTDHIGYVKSLWPIRSHYESS